MEPERLSAEFDRLALENRAELGLQMLDRDTAPPGDVEDTIRCPPPSFEEGNVT